MIEIVTAAALLLAWYVFRYERHQGRRLDAEAARGTLSAVHHGMLGRPNERWGWGRLYFEDYSHESALARSRVAYELVMAGKIDQVLVVPTEPLAMLAATPPRPGLIDSETVRLANIAPWRLHVFNQLVQQLTDFNTQHAVEIRSERTDDQRRTELTDAAAGHSALIHADGIGMAWSDGQGWFRTLAAALGEDMLRLDRAARRRW